MNTVTPTFTYKSVSYTVTCNKNTAVEGEKVYVYNAKSSINIKFSGEKNQETYLRYTFNNYSNIDEDKSNLDKKQIGKNTSKHTLPSKMKMRFSFKTDDGKKYKTDFVTCYSSSYVRYTGAKTYLVGLGYTENAKNSIKITFDQPGIYDLSDIEVFEQPIDQASQQIADLKADTMQNVKMGKNKITGTIDLQKAKMLCISIPYSKGWSATVDGKKAELLQADTAFSALALDKGKHTIELQYHTPYLKEGAYISTAGVIAFAVLIIITEKRKKTDYLSLNQ